MPEIILSTDGHLRDHTLHSSANTVLYLGDWRFVRIKVSPIYGLVAGSRDIIGFEETYYNPHISQQETNDLMEQFKKETGQENHENDLLEA